MADAGNGCTSEIVITVPSQSESVYAAEDTISRLERCHCYTLSRKAPTFILFPAINLPTIHVPLFIPRNLDNHKFIFFISINVSPYSFSSGYTKRYYMYKSREYCKIKKRGRTLCYYILQTAFFSFYYFYCKSSTDELKRDWWYAASHLDGSIFSADL